MNMHHGWVWGTENIETSHVYAIDCWKTHFNGNIAKLVTDNAVCEKL